ncbi:fatty acid desaturase [Streptomyces goshikiensis]|uniref:fatty acid desaturase n=1 Tax=Streptomyces goshikiensis TaxID=1942 RepID=UPI00332F335E
MLLALLLLTAGITLRQADRLHHAIRSPHAAGAAQLVALQRSRGNIVTPTLLLLGQWVQITGWWLLAPYGVLGACAAAIGTAVHFRHLQEISHHAVHGVLAPTRRSNDFLAEAFAHLPLGLAAASVRRKRHVRDHHPNATLAQDPNLLDLERAGLRRGSPITLLRFTAALLHPLSLAGVGATAADLARALSRTGRLGPFLAVPAAAYLTAGWPGLLFGWLIPRLLLYPLLAWWSLVVEHTWFDPQPRTGQPVHVEGGRCLRLYPRNRALALFAAATWLPYGDLRHYAHSVHPAVRWNYLPALERHLPSPHFTPAAMCFGRGSLAQRHHQALMASTSTGQASEQYPGRGRRSTSTSSSAESLTLNRVSPTREARSMNASKSLRQPTLPNVN